MRKLTTPLTPDQVYRCAIEFCQPHLDLRGKGKVTATVLLTVAFAAAARCSSIHETCSRLAGAPCDDTYAKALYVDLKALEPIVRKVNAAFRATCLAPCAARASGRSASSSTSPSSPIMANVPWTTSRSTAARRRPAPARASPTPPPT